MGYAKGRSGPVPPFVGPGTGPIQPIPAPSEIAGSRVPREVVQSVKEYAENEYEDAPEGTDARIVWSVILAMCNERLS